MTAERKASAIAENTVTKGEVGIYLDGSPDDCISLQTLKNMGQRVFYTRRRMFQKAYPVFYTIYRMF